MIIINLYYQNNSLYKVESIGHANKVEGLFYPCFGVSLLLRTFTRSLLEKEIKIKLTLQKEGEFFLEAIDPLDKMLCAFLERGLNDLETEFPKEIKIYRS